MMKGLIKTLQCGGLKNYESLTSRGDRGAMLFYPSTAHLVTAEQDSRLLGASPSNRIQPHKKKFVYDSQLQGLLTLARLDSLIDYFFFSNGKGQGVLQVKVCLYECCMDGGGG